MRLHAFLMLAIFAFAPVMLAQEAEVDRTEPGAETSEAKRSDDPDSEQDLPTPESETEAATEPLSIEPLRAKEREIRGAGIGWSFFSRGEDIITLRLNGQVRARGEVREPLSIGANAQNRGDARQLLRTRLSFQFDLPMETGVFLELQDSRRFGEEEFAQSSTDEGLDMLQAYFYAENVMDSGIDIYAGRQRFNIGDQRLWGSLDWSNTGRAWDGIRIDCECDNMPWRVFWMNVADEIGAGRNENHAFGGSIGYKGFEGHEQEFVAIYNFRREGFDERLLTVSGRAAGKLAGFDYSAELVYQIGETEEFGLTATGERSDVSAFAAGVRLKRDFDVGLANPLGAMVGWDFASGGSNSDDSVSTFKAPFITGHKYNGAADVVGYRNIHDFHGGASYTTDGWWERSEKAITFKAVWHSFFRHNANDGLYSVGGAQIRSGDSTDAKHIGNEIDLFVTARIHRYLKMELGYSHFFAGGYIEDSSSRGVGFEDDVDFAYVTLQVDF